MSRRKPTPSEKTERRRRKAEFMTIFVNGNQERVRRPQTIDGMDVDEFILRNADPIWLHENGMWERLEDSDGAQQIAPADRAKTRAG
jgi:hypothetical protein